MIIVPVKEGENIERALKKFKRKFEKTGVPFTCSTCVTRKSKKLLKKFGSFK